MTDLLEPDAAAVDIAPPVPATWQQSACIAVAVTEVDDAMHAGHVSLPNGLGLDHPGADGTPIITGVAPNELTASEHRDPVSGTAWHKHVPARLERVEAAQPEVGS